MFDNLYLEKSFLIVFKPRMKENNTYEGTTWQVKFELEALDPNGIYALQLALAAAHSSELEVSVYFCSFMFLRTSWYICFNTFNANRFGSTIRIQTHLCLQLES